MTSPIWLLLGFFGFVMATVLVAGYLLLERRASRSTSAALAPGEGALLSSGGSAMGEALRSLGASFAHPRIATEEVRSLLLRAGYRNPGTAAVFQGILGASAILLGLICGMWGMVARQDLGIAFVAAVGGAGAGFILPKRILAYLAKVRARRLSAGLPTALDLLLLNIEAGRGLDHSMAETSKGVQGNYPDLADEFNQVCLELKAGRARTDVLHALADRCGDIEVRKLVNLLVDTDRFGTSLAPSLRIHAKYLRTRRRQKAQETARKLSVKLVFPVFFLIFPAILLVTLGPAVIAVFSQLIPMLTGAK